MLDKGYIINLLENNNEFDVEELKNIKNMLSLDISDSDIEQSDNEKKERIVNMIYGSMDDGLLLSCVEDLNDDFKKNFLIQYIFETSKKIEAIKQLKESILIVWSILEIESIDDKRDILKYYNEYNYYLEVAKALPDEEKFELLADIDNDQLVYEIILLMKSDENKIYARNFFSDINNMYSKKVIEKLDSDEYKLEFLDSFEESEEQIRILCSIKDDKIKQDYINIINDSDNMIHVISSLSTDELKIEYVKDIEDDKDKANILVSLNSDEEKIKSMKYIDADISRANVLSSLSDDYMKIEYMNNYNYSDENESFFRSIVLRSFENDELKCKCINEVDDDFDKVKVIETISSSKTRASLVGILKSDCAKSLIVKRFMSDSLKIGLLNEFKDEKYKAIVISSIRNDKEKLDYLNNIIKEENKISIVCSLSDDSIKSSFMFNDERVSKIRIALSMRNQDNRVNCLNDLYPVVPSPKEIGIDPKITFGVELEAEGKYSNSFKGQYYNWKAVMDSSLNNGIELVSPVMTDNTSDINEIYKICAVMNELSLIANDNCGGHIHLGADYLETKEDWETFVEIYSNCEKEIYMLSNAPGNVTRKGVESFASPISPNIEEAMEKGTFNINSISTKNEFIDGLMNLQSSRGTSINFLNVNSASKNTVEFRLSNGTINPNEVVDNVRLFAKLFEKSKEISRITNLKDSKSKETKNQYKVLLDENIADEEKAGILVNMLFDNENDKRKYMERYSENSKMLENLDNSRNPFSCVKFGKVGNIKEKFKEQDYESVYREFEQENNIERE